MGGALFFTIYFGFINVKRFPTAINTVRGKYDEVDDHSSDREDGEVSHFQALATAVSGTVGNGNIAGVALAIAIGGPGATLDDSLWFNRDVNKICRVYSGGEIP